MARIVHLLAFAASLSAIAANAQDTALAWFPLRTGSRWVYDNESKSGDRNQPEVERWSTEETITGELTVPEGFVMLRQVGEPGNAGAQAVPNRGMAKNGSLRYMQAEPHGSYLTARDNQPYLVRGNCVYAIDGWDRQKQALRPEYLKQLNEGDVSPDVCFPLKMGQKWGNHDIHWEVSAAPQSAIAFLPMQYAGAVHFVCEHFGSGGRMEVWFQKGIGVVGEHYVHNGTYDEYTKKLRSFVP